MQPFGVGEGTNNPHGVLNLNVSAQNTANIHAFFMPTVPSQLSSSILVCNQSEFSSLDVFGRGGLLSLTSNLGPPIEASPEPAPKEEAVKKGLAKRRPGRREKDEARESVVPKSLSPAAKAIDLGLAELGVLMRKQIVITNNGTLPIRVMAIVAPAAKSTGGTWWSFQLQERTVGMSPGQMLGMARISLAHQTLLELSKARAAVQSKDQPSKSRRAGLQPFKGSMLLQNDALAEVQLGQAGLHELTIDWDERDWVGARDEDGEGQKVEEQMENEGKQKKPEKAEGAKESEGDQQQSGEGQMKVGHQAQARKEFIKDKILKRREIQAQHSSELPIILHPDYCLALDIWFLQERSGIYDTSLTVSCREHIDVTSTLQITKVETTEDDVKTKTKSASGSKRDMVPAIGQDGLNNADFQFNLKYRVEKALEIDEGDRHLDFGVVPVSETKTMWFSFSNTGAIPLSWEICKLSSEVSEPYSNPKKLLAQTRATRHAFSIESPCAGVMQPGDSASVEVRFSAEASHQAIEWRIVLVTVGLGFCEVRLTGISGKPKLRLDAKEVDFGIISIGNRKREQVPLINMGELPAYFEISSGSNDFHLLPSRGVVQPQSQLDLEVSFTPNFKQGYKSWAEVKWGKSESSLPNVLSFDVKGQGGTQDLLVKTKKLDFGGALLNYESVRSLRVYNEGDAQALIMVDIEEPTIKLMNVASGQDLFVLPKDHIDLEFCFIPTELEPLDTVIVISGKGKQSKQYSIQVVGSPGVPNIVVHPNSIMHAIDYGICLTRTTHTKEFTLNNHGSIGVKYEIVFVRPKIPSDSEDDEEDDQEGARNKKNELDTNQVVTELPPTILDRIIPRSKAALLHNAKTQGVVPKRLLLGTSAPLGDLGPGSPSFLRSDRKMDLESAIDMLEECEPENLSISPASGFLKKNSEQTLTLTYTPRGDLELTRYGIIIRPQYTTPLYGNIKGIAGQRSLRFDSPFRVLDFGNCRMGGRYSRKVDLSNSGNIACNFHIDPDPEDPFWARYHDADYNQVCKKFMVHLMRMGFYVETDGKCLAKSKASITFMYQPVSEESVHVKLRVVSDGKGEVFTLSGGGARSLLVLMQDRKTEFAPPHELHFGLQTVDSKVEQVLYLANRGSLAASFVASPGIPRDFLVRPLKGDVPPGGHLPIQISFRPSSCQKHKFKLKFIGPYSEEDTPELTVTAEGGVGKLGVLYLDKKDQGFHGLDFGLVSVGSIIEKHLMIYNNGAVATNIHVEIDSAFFTLGRSGPFGSLSEIEDEHFREQELMHYSTQQGYHETKHKWANDEEDDSEDDKEPGADEGSRNITVKTRFRDTWGYKHLPQPRTPPFFVSFFLLLFRIVLFFSALFLSFFFFFASMWS